MKEKILQFIAKSERELRVARKHLHEGDYDFSVSRAYYAMFHMTEALLLTKKVASSKHSGLLSLFYEHFIKTEILEKNLHQDLHRAFELRQQGDYWSESEITKEMAADLLEKAGRYISILKKYLK